MRTEGMHAFYLGGRGGNAYDWLGPTIFCWYSVMHILALSDQLGCSVFVSILSGKVSLVVQGQPHYFVIHERAAAIGCYLILKFCA